MSDEAIRRLADRYGDTPEDAEALREATRRRLAWRARRGGKECSKCRETKPVSAFGRDATRSDGLRIYCRACR